MKSKMDCRTVENARNTASNASIGGLASGGTTSGGGTYETGKQSNGNGKLAVGLLAGAGVGILAGMLLAPERGKVLRTQVVNSATTLGNQVTNQVTKGMDYCKETVSSLTGKSKSRLSSDRGALIVEEHLIAGGEPAVVDPARNNPRYF